MIQVSWTAPWVQLKQGTSLWLAVFGLLHLCVTSVCNALLVLSASTKVLSYDTSDRLYVPKGTRYNIHYRLLRV